MKRTLSMAFIATLFSAATAQTTVTFQVSNPSKAPRTDVPVIIPLEAGWGPVATAIVTDGQKEIPCQLDDLDQDGTFDELCFLADLKSKENATYQVTFAPEGEPRTYPARVYAEMLIRNDKVKEKNKHNNFIESITARGDCANSYNIQHHHGVDFESELNGIRIYFDQRHSGRPSTSTVSTRNGWNLRPPSSIPPRSRKPRDMATMCFGWATPSDLVPFAAGMVSSPR